MSRLATTYKEKVLPELKKELGDVNVHTVPYVKKVVINVGYGKQSGNAKALETVHNTLRKITGQEPIKTVAKKSIAAFKLREGAEVGMKVTLRGERMYEFMDRLISVVLPRTRDFRGLSPKAFDKQGNYSIGIRDQSVFPELSFDEVTFTHGLQINIVTDSGNIDSSLLLLKKLGFPFERGEE